MADWILTKGLQNLRSQINTAFPHRDKTSDGTIGDAAHQAEISGHNPDDTAGSTPEWNGDPDTTPEVRAWDMDADLGEGVTAQQVVDHLRRLPGLALVIRYMIFDRTMYHERDAFKPTPYTGASAHLEHVHFSGAWSQDADNNTSYNYHLEELTMAVLDDADVKKIITGVRNTAEFLSDTDVDIIASLAAKKVQPQFDALTSTIIHLSAQIAAITIGDIPANLAQQIVTALLALAKSVPTP
jgi:hypothetical protein